MALCGAIHGVGITGGVMVALIAAGIIQAGDMAGVDITAAGVDITEVGAMDTTMVVVATMPAMTATMHRTELVYMVLATTVEAMCAPTEVAM
jgi:hypothetical protein